MTAALVFTFLAAFLLVLGGAGLARGERKGLVERFKKYTSPGEAQAPRRSLGKEVLRRGGALFDRSRLAARVEEKLAQADLPLRGSEYLFLVALLGCGAFLVFWALTRRLGLALLGGAAGFGAPWVHLARARARRISLFNAQLADVLAALANSLRAGYSFLQAVEVVARELPPPVATEFGRALREMQLGASTETALVNLSRRVGSEDLDLVVTAIIIQRQVGGNLAEVLDNISETIRERVRIKGEVRVLTAQGRISGLVVGLLPVALFLFLYAFNPGYVGLLFRDPVGVLLLAGALCGEAVGFLVIRRIVEIEV